MTFYSTRSLVLLFLSAAQFVSVVNGHGRMTLPAHRGYMFKSGNKKVPVDYNDHGLNAGGLSLTKGGKGQHGVCGDPFSEKSPRAHENGGKFGVFPKYGKDAIAQCYAPGATIDIKVHLTANHKGYFEYELCKLEKKGDVETEGCFKKLQKAGGGTKVDVPSDKKDFNDKYVLPKGVTCEGDSHCVLRWHYTCGNNQPVATATQEELWNCADVYVSSNCGGAGDKGGSTQAPTGSPKDDKSKDKDTTVAPTDAPKGDKSKDKDTTVAPTDTPTTSWE